MPDAINKELETDNLMHMEEDRGLISEKKKETIQQIQNERLKHWSFLGICTISSFMIGILLGTALINENLKRNEHLRYEPVMGSIGLQYHNVQFNGSLFKNNKFRQDAGPEVDAAWKSMGVDYRSAIVPSSMGPKAGLTPSHVQVSEKYGGGYPANVEGLHHLHCLNLVRQALYWNFDYYQAQGQGAFSNNKDVLKSHVYHCLDIVRQQLMCSVDVGVLGQIWWKPDEPQAYPDFNTEHRCRDFEAIRKWAEEHQAPEDVPEDYLQPPGPNDVADTIP